MFSLMYLWFHFTDMMSALGLGEEEDIESPWDSEVLSSVIILKCKQLGDVKTKAEDAVTFSP